MDLTFTVKDVWFKPKKVLPVKSSLLGRYGQSFCDRQSEGWGR